MHTPPPCTSPQALPGGESALPAADQEQGDPDIEVLKMSKEAERFRKFKLKQMDCKRQELLINEQKLALLEIELALMGPPPSLKRIKAEVKAEVGDASINPPLPCHTSPSTATAVGGDPTQIAQSGSQKQKTHPPDAPRELVKESDTQDATQGDLWIEVMKREQGAYIPGIKLDGSGRIYQVWHPEFLAKGVKVGDIVYGVDLSSGLLNPDEEKSEYIGLRVTGSTIDPLMEMLTSVIGWLNIKVASTPPQRRKPLDNQKKVASAQAATGEKNLTKGDKDGKLQANVAAAGVAGEKDTVDQTKTKAAAANVIGKRAPSKRDKRVKMQASATGANTVGERDPADQTEASVAIANVVREKGPADQTKAKTLVKKGFYLCSRCSQTLSTPYTMRRHLLDVHLMAAGDGKEAGGSTAPQGFYSCPQCANTVATNANLKRHLRNVHNLLVNASGELLQRTEGNHPIEEGGQPLPASRRYQAWLEATGTALSATEATAHMKAIGFRGKSVADWYNHPQLPIGWMIR